MFTYIISEVLLLLFVGHVKAANIPNSCSHFPFRFRLKTCSDVNPCSPKGIFHCIEGKCCAKNNRVVPLLRQLANRNTDEDIKPYFADKDIRQQKDSTAYFEIPQERRGKTGGSALCKRYEDVTVIGAGIGGTYTGWRLRNEGYKIGIYEYSNRVGGRILTTQFPAAPDKNIELGAMRLLPSLQSRMNQTATALGLTLLPFVQEFGLHNETLYYLRNTHLFPHQLGGPKTPYRLLSEEQVRPDVLKRMLSENFTNYNGTDPVKELFSAVTITDGMPIYKQSYTQVFQKTGLSKEAYNYITDTAVFVNGFMDAQCTYQLPQKRVVPKTGGYRDIPIGEVPVYFVETGMESYPKGFLAEFIKANPKRHGLFLNEKLTKVSRVGDEFYKLTFSKTKTMDGYTFDTHITENVCTKHLIMALPKEPIQNIDLSDFPSDFFQEALNSVKDDQAAKVFLLYRYPWWRQVNLNATYTKSDLPMRQSYDFGVTKDGMGVLLASYTDGNGVPYWRQLQKIGEPLGNRQDKYRVTDVVVKQAHIQLSQVYNVTITTIPYPIDGMMVTWDDYPFSGVWSTWHPGYNWIDVKQYLTKPFFRENIFIVHGYWGSISYNSWAEGSLEAADQVLLNFGLEPLAPIPGYL